METAREIAEPNGHAGCVAVRVSSMRYRAAVRSPAIGNCPTVTPRPTKFSRRAIAFGSPLWIERFFIVAFRSEAVKKSDGLTGWSPASLSGWNRRLNG